MDNTRSDLVKSVVGGIEMKKEELIALGVEEEVAKQILVINGRDIEKHKKLAEAYRIDMEKANDELEKYKGVDIDGLNKQIEDWKVKYDTDTQALNEQLKSQATEFKVQDYLSKFQFTSERVKSSIMADFMKQGFEVDENGVFVGADEYMTKLQESEPTSFVNDKTPYFAKSTQGQGTKTPGSKKLEEMTYSEAVAFLAANPGYQI